MGIGLSLRKLVLPVLMVAVIAILLLILWRQHAELVQQRSEGNKFLAQQEERLRQDVLQVHHASKREQSAASVVRIQRSDTSGEQELRQDDSKLREPAHEVEPHPEPNNLVLSETTVKAITSGLMATLRFSPKGTGALGELDLIIRLPKEGDSRILDLAPDDPVKYSEVAKRVSENGKFAIFQGVPKDVATMQFDLSVSEPATADVRGTCGIEPFQLEIRPTGTTVHRN